MILSSVMSELQRTGIQLTTWPRFSILSSSRVAVSFQRYFPKPKVRLIPTSTL